MFFIEKHDIFSEQIFYLVDLFVLCFRYKEGCMQRE